MEYYLLIARSVTHAQQLSQALGQCGVRAGVLRAPTDLSQEGCSYAVRVRTEHGQWARVCLRQAGISPKAVFFRSGGSYREVVW